MGQLELWDCAVVTVADIPDFVCQKNDNQRLIHYQHDYLMDRTNKKAWNDLWMLSLEVAAKFIRKEQKLKGLTFDNATFEDYKICAVEYVLRRYDKWDDYFIKESFTSELYYGVKHALYYRSQSEIVFSGAMELMNSQKLDLMTALNKSKKDYEQKVGRKKLRVMMSKSQLSLFDL